MLIATSFIVALLHVPAAPAFANDNLGLRSDQDDGLVWVPSAGRESLPHSRLVTLAGQLPTAPTWGACGLSSSETNLVFQFPSLSLMCGGPLYSSDPTWGYCHILKNHQDRFSGLAALAGRRWRDLAHWAIYYNDIDTDREYARGTSTCRSRVLYLVNSSGQVVKQQIFRTINNNTNGRVITAYPSSSQCERP